MVVRRRFQQFLLGALNEPEWNLKRHQSSLSMYQLRCWEYFSHWVVTMLPAFGVGLRQKKAQHIFLYPWLYNGFSFQLRSANYQSKSTFTAGMVLPTHHAETWENQGLRCFNRPLGWVSQTLGLQPWVGNSLSLLQHSHMQNRPKTAFPVGRSWRLRKLIHREHLGYCLTVQGALHEICIMIIV